MNYLRYKNNVKYDVLPTILISLQIHHYNTTWQQLTPTGHYMHTCLYELIQITVYIAACPTLLPLALGNTLINVTNLKIDWTNPITMHTTVTMGIQIQ